MWLLRRLKIFKLEPELILDYYLKEIRPCVEQGVPIWNSGITKAQARLIENIQKVAFKIILGEHYISYNVACTLLGVSPLEYRKTDLSTNFAIKLFKSPRSKEFFEPISKNVNTRSAQNMLVAENLTNTRRCYNAPHNYLARLLNKNRSRVEKSKK